MATGLKSAAEPGISSLVDGIVDDAQKLVEQQIILFRREIEGEIRRVKSAAISLAIGSGITAIGTLLLLLMTVHAVHAATGLPLWGCYGLVGGVIVGIGALLLCLGRREAAAIHLIPPLQTSEALKENVQWLQKQAALKQS
jgi:hypothetical protein